MNQTTENLASTAPPADRAALAPAASGEDTVDSPFGHDHRRYGVVIDGVRLLLPAGVRSELLAMQALARLPLSPAELVGMMNARGTLLAVFDLSLLPHWREIPTGDVGSAGKPMILMLDQGLDALGLIIQGFPKALKKVTATSIPSLPSPYQPFVKNAWSDPEGATWIDLDLVAMLLARASRPAEARPTPNNALTEAGLEENV